MNETRKLALSGVLCAVALLVMLLGNVLPILTYAAPCLCGLIVAAVLQRCGLRYAWALYGAITLLSLMLLTDREQALFFALIAGYYPMFFRFAESRIASRTLRYVAKLLLFNAALAGITALLFFVFFYGAEALWGDSWAIAVGLVVIGNAVFLLYDRLLARLLPMMEHKLSFCFFKNRHG